VGICFSYSGNFGNESKLDQATSVLQVSRQ